MPKSTTNPQSTTTRPSENSVTVECLNYMRSRGWRAYRMHVGVYQPISGGPPVAMGERGCPDWLLIHPTESPLFLEFKRPGATPEKHQEEYIAKMRFLGFNAEWTDNLNKLKELGY